MFDRIGLSRDGLRAGAPLAGLPRPARGVGLPIALLGAWMALVSVACAPRVQGPPAAPPIAGYVVGAPDELQVTILPEPTIDRSVRVRPDGMISIDLIGDVRAAGRTPFEIAEDIRRSISRFKRDASVNVSVVSSPSQFVTVYGEVNAPGVFALDSETRVHEAIGRVGGTRPFASRNSIRIVRTRGAQAEIIKVRLADIERGDLSTNFVVASGDLIVVPPTILARFGYVMQMLFFPFQPVVSAIGAVGTTSAGVQQFD